MKFMNSSRDYIIALDELRRQVDALGYIDEGSVEQAREILGDLTDNFNRLRNQAFEIVRLHAESLPRPQEYVGERVRALTLRTTGQNAWERLGTITRIVEHRWGQSLYVTLDGDDHEGLWGREALTPVEAFQVVGEVTL